MFLSKSQVGESSTWGIKNWDGWQLRCLCEDDLYVSLVWYGNMVHQHFPTHTEERSETAWVKVIKVGFFLEMVV